MIADDPTQWTGQAATPQAWLSLNVNDQVRVKLTDVGMAEYRRRREDFRREFPGAPSGSDTPALDADGYYRTQLWSLMADFGHLMFCGGQVPFETAILLPAASVAAAHQTPI